MCASGVGGWLQRRAVEKMCNAMVKEIHGELSDSIDQGGREMESDASAYVLSTSIHAIMQKWEETHQGAASVADRWQN